MALASDFEITYSGDGTGNQESNRNAPCTRLTEDNYTPEGYVYFNFGDIEKPLYTVGIRLRAMNGNKAGDFAWNDIPLTKKVAVPLNDTQELSVVVSGKTLQISFQPDSRGSGQEVMVTNTSTSESVIIAQAMDDFSEAWEGAYSTTYIVQHRTIGDDVYFLNSEWVAAAPVTTDAAPAPAQPAVSFVAVFDESDPTKLKATYTVTLNPAPTETTLVNIRRSNAATGVVEQLQFKYLAGQTQLAPVYNFVYANLNPDIEEVVFEVLPGTGYTRSGTTSVTRALNYTPPQEEVSMLATESLHIRSGANAATNYSTAPYLELKTDATSGETRNAVIGWNTNISNVPTTLKLHIENYAVAKRGTIEAYAMTGGFDPAVDNWNTLIAKKGALLGSANFSPASPYVNIDLGGVTAAGEYSLMLVGTGYSSGVEYHISKPGSANPPTLADTVLPTLVDITTLGTVGTANDSAVLANAIATTQANGQGLLIDTGTIVNLPVGTFEITQNDVYIDLRGEIRAALKTHNRANDWKYQGILDRAGTPDEGKEYVWSDNSASVDYQKRQTAYNSGYNAISWTGRRGKLVGGGAINGQFDNTLLNTWGAKLSPALIKVTGEGFVGKFKVKNAAGNGFDITSEGANISEVVAENCGYSEIRINATQALEYMSVGITGGKATTKPNVRMQSATVNGSSILKVLNLPVVNIRGAMLLEGAVGDSNPDANTTFFEEVNIGLLDLHPDIPMTYEDGKPASYNTGKAENTRDMNIVKFLERSALQDMGAFWFDKLSGKLRIGERDSTLTGFRVGVDTVIDLNIQTRDSAYNPTYIGWFKITKAVSLTINEFRVENNGYGDMSGTFAIFDMQGQSPNIRIKSIVNNGGAKIPLARLSSTTGSGTIKIGTGLSVTQQLAYLSARNIYVSSAMQRLLAAS